MGQRSPLAAVAAVNAAIACAPDAEAVLTAALRPLLAETGAEANEVFLLARPQQEMVLAAHCGLYPEAFHQITRFHLGEGFPGIVAASGESLLTHRLQDDRRYLRTRVKELGFQHYLCLPLKAGGEVVGCLNLASRRPLMPGAALLCQTVAHPLALALDRAYLAAQERQRLARELHDGLAHSIGLVAQQAELLIRLSRRDPRAAPAEAAALRRAVQDSLEELRCAVRGMPPPALDLGLDTALRRLAASFTHYYRVAVKFQAQGDVGQLPPSWELPIYRIAQEAIANAIRHGQPTQVEVVLRVDAPQVSLTVRDNGRGFGPPPHPIPGHRGLAHMRERAQTLGGRLHIQSSPDKGTTVRLTAHFAEPQVKTGPC